MQQSTALQDDSQDDPRSISPRQPLRRGAALARTSPASSRKASKALIDAVGALVDKAIDRALLTADRVTSAADADRLLAGDTETEALPSALPRAVVLAGPTVRRVIRGARSRKGPW